MYENMSVVTLAKSRMDWVAQRQEILAQNIANADTPKYIPQDITPFDFEAALQKSNPNSVQVTTTNPMHITPVMQDPTKVTSTKKTYESAPDGNSVILEEQTAKLGEAKSNYDLAASLFQKQYKLISTALSKSS